MVFHSLCVHVFRNDLGMIRCSLLSMPPVELIYDYWYSMNIDLDVLIIWQYFMKLNWIELSSLDFFSSLIDCLSFFISLIKDNYSMIIHWSKTPVIYQDNNLSLTRDPFNNIKIWSYSKYRSITVFKSTDKQYFG